MTIEPDTKDWTWVLSKPCEQCGFDASTVVVTELPTLVRAASASWEQVLERPNVRERPDASRWSPLEYGCHVRDVFVLYDERLRLMVEHDNPTFPNWDQDQAATASRYEDQDLVEVAAELTFAAELLADRFAAVSGDMWQRRGTRSDGKDFSLETFGLYFIHDPIHHLADVGA